MNRTFLQASGALAILAFATSAPTVAAAQASDPSGDFIPSYLGPPNPNVDVVSASVTYDGASFLFTGTMAGPILPADGAFYVWGIDRGAGTARFPAIAPGVLFDSVIVVRPGGASSATELTPGPPVAHPLDPAAVTISGNTISALVPGAFLPTQGFDPTQYTWNLWPRNSSAPAGNAQISDFAPDNSNLLVQVVPEPSVYALVAAGGVFALGLTRRRR